MAEKMTSEPIQSVIVCGSGLALWMTTAALSQTLPDSVKITVIETGSAPIEDAFYGQILPLQAYKFHLSIGLSEPELLLKTHTSFAYGTHVQNWALTDRSWVQAFHQPFPVIDGVPLAKLIQHHEKLSLQDLLISAQAVQNGVFAHPPENADHPLSRAEYGYAFDHGELTALYKAVALLRPIQNIQDSIDHVARTGADISALTLSTGQKVSADLFIDCSGPAAVLQDPETVQRIERQTLHASIGRIEGTPLAQPAQTLTSGNFGWQSDVILRGGTSRLTVFHADSDADAKAAHAIEDGATAALQLGHVDKAWSGNSIAVGQAAYTLEPITTAPIKLLFRDIDRLSNLFPVSGDMKVEAKEYNRLYADDIQHAEIFNQAHFALPNLPDAPYWTTAKVQPQDPKLVRKLTQYDSRGHMVAYDKEPFDEVDWAILHDGIGRQPRRRDPLASLADPSMVTQSLDQLFQSIQASTKKIPPYPIYMSKLLSYLNRKFSQND